LIFLQVTSKIDFNFTHCFPTMNIQKVINILTSYLSNPISNSYIKDINISSKFQSLADIMKSVFNHLGTSNSTNTKSLANLN
jgi:hypothetical protein